MKLFKKVFAPKKKLDNFSVAVSKNSQMSKTDWLKTAPETDILFFFFLPVEENRQDLKAISILVAWVCIRILSFKDRWAESLKMRE